MSEKKIFAGGEIRFERRKKLTQWIKSMSEKEISSFRDNPILITILNFEVGDEIYFFDNYIWSKWDVVDVSFDKCNNRKIQLRLLADYLDNDRKANIGFSTGDCLQKFYKLSLRQSEQIFTDTETGGTFFNNYGDKSKLLVKKTRAEAITIIMKAYGMPVSVNYLSKVLYNVSSNASIQEALNGMMDILQRKRSGRAYLYNLKKVGETTNFYYYSYGEDFENEIRNQAIMLTEQEYVEENWNYLKRDAVVLLGYKRHIVSIGIVREIIKIDDAKKPWKVKLDVFVFPHAVKIEYYYKKLKNDVNRMDISLYSLWTPGKLILITQEIMRFFMDAIAGEYEPETVSVGDAKKYFNTDHVFDIKQELKCEFDMLSEIYNEKDQKKWIKPVHNGKPKPKAENIMNAYSYGYKRNHKISLNALAYADYSCEYDKTHISFIRKNTKEAYMEPHHLIPLKYSDLFKVSLDIEENIVSLCSNCHNQIHYGEGAGKIIEDLYEQRKEELEKVGLKIEKEVLLSLYD